MLTAARRRAILEFVARDGEAKTRDLAAALAVSEVTIRSDLDALAKDGHVQRTHGGAVTTASGEISTSVRARSQLNAEAKRRIAAAAAGLVRAEETVVLDAGSTLLALARVFPSERNVTVLTPGISIAQQLAPVAGVEVRVLGGRLFARTMVTVGSPREQGLEAVVAHTAFMGAGGVDPDLDAVESSFDLAAAKRALIRAARRKILLVDSSKWTEAGKVKVAPVASFDIVITDEGLAPERRRELADLGVDLRIV
jgi:DeoR/GlpR family transcriptional regulator of sugar metabolism